MIYQTYEFVVMFDPYLIGMNIYMHRGLCNRYKIQNDTSNQGVILIGPSDRKSVLWSAYGVGSLPSR